MAGYWQLAPRSGGGANAGSAGTGPLIGAPSVRGGLERVARAWLTGVLLLALFVGASLWVTRETTNATTAANARSDPPTTPTIRRLFEEGFAAAGCAGPAGGACCAGPVGGAGGVESDCAAVSTDAGGDGGLGAMA